MIVFGTFIFGTGGFEADAVKTKTASGTPAGQRKQSNGSAAGTIKRNINGVWQ